MAPTRKRSKGKRKTKKRLWGGTKRGRSPEPNVNSLSRAIKKLNVTSNNKDHTKNASARPARPAPPALNSAGNNASARAVSADPPAINRAANKAVADGRLLRLLPKNTIKKNNYQPRTAPSNRSKVFNTSDIPSRPIIPVQPNRIRVVSSLEEH